MSLRDQIVASYESDSLYANIIAHLRAPSVESMKKLTRPTQVHIKRYRFDGSVLTLSTLRVSSY
ncbi:hypothetical protein PI124_g18305 [Phytophthora idaei]|nr:hypothetical protein PI125_g20414 [Phytophthora idaei]KAG3133998.1 hypothetical protein PI126_g18894 [Phytophthora idaei]KAG3236689.1 hypothetical protein PI124_g18305 [Phytophthora idaei]